MTHDDELIERVARVLATSNIASIYKRGATPSEADHYWPSFRDDAQSAIAAVRAYDAERRSSVLDVEALKTFDPQTPGTLVWLPDGAAAKISAAVEESGYATRDADIVHVRPIDESPKTWVVSVKATPGLRATDEQLCEMTKYDPDDYRDLPLAMTGPVKFQGGLTEGKS